MHGWWQRGRRAWRIGLFLLTACINAAGPVRSRGWRSTAPLFSATASTSSSATTRRPQSNLRLAAVRRVAYEAADAGLVNPEVAASIRRVKAVAISPTVTSVRPDVPFKSLEVGLPLATERYLTSATPDRRCPLKRAQVHVVHYRHVAEDRRRG